jgi:hypothetical protein
LGELLSCVLCVLAGLAGIVSLFDCAGVAFGPNGSASAVQLPLSLNALAFILIAIVVWRLS